MGTTKRLELAIQKLYTAFQNDGLHPECCKQCAVGNILDTTDSWKHFSDQHGSLNLNYVGLVNQNFGKTFNGYSPLELLQIEAEFLKACGYQLPLNHNNKRPKNPTDKDVLFLGLSAVVAYLCQLDEIPDVMDCSELFQYEIKNNPNRPLVSA
ncbi:Na(+)-translocating NADH-quinone reductase subunit F [Xanthomarina sp. F2636L]|uniref:Na(+)-translocating NADH-quinone reductase subunit F n=1 Tax=Xanthomarina sp. F2636L TaxID=2996018 RepID=UPI00225E5B20|nr:Na(+)-translocating NADH-quinone reductase subunit F [Xanthomarina sp. F2636L]MCX7550800.1 Na(+)-translocating NADH-quinone reductase subunit F [Xanthomarina sp. F2636L]